MMPRGVEVFVGLEPIDLRWSFDRLAGLVEGRLSRQARSRAVFVFFGKHHSAVKVLFFDGTGLCLFYKRLDRGSFNVPTGLDATATSVQLTENELDELLSGLELVPRPRIMKTRVH
jgi:transposase